jgi:transcriptional regulator with XRE-family HTH domain
MMSNSPGEYLRELRDNKGLTTRQLSQAAACSHALVTLVKKGDRHPSLDRLWPWVQVLEGNFVRAVYLLCLDTGVPEEIAAELMVKHSNANIDREVTDDLSNRKRF